MAKPKVMLIFGTRPETIKLAPVHRELQRRRNVFEVCMVVTAQHREMLDQFLTSFGIEPDIDLDIMTQEQSLYDITARAVRRLGPVLQQMRPDVVLVQGDTATVFAASLAAYYERVAVGHVEAGLRTDNKYDPFPEEIYRRLTSVIADLHFAPTQGARQRLLSEGIPDEKIFVTGNPVIDALQWAASLPFDFRDTPYAWLSDFRGRLILVTAHRRESHGEGHRQVFGALKELAGKYGDVTVLYPMHLSPAVRRVAHEVLDGVERVILTDPPEYITFVNLMKRAFLIITDSGGLQEEAPSLGVPVLVVRKTSERPEGIEAGTAVLAGTDRAQIAAAASRLLEDQQAYQQMAQATNPYGDGHAAERICDALEEYFSTKSRAQ